MITSAGFVGAYTGCQNFTAVGSTLLAISTSAWLTFGDW